MKSCTIFILSLLILSCFSQSCANVADPNDRIQSGSLQITTTYTPTTVKGVAYQRQNAFTVPFRIPVTSGYQIIACRPSLNTAFSEYAMTSVGISSQDFSISAIPLTENSAKLIVLINDDGTWTRLKVSYLVTARSDFFLGTFVGDGYFKPKNSNGELLFSYSIPVWNPQTSQATAIALLSGLRVIMAELPLLKISNAKLNTTSGRLEVAVAFNSQNTFQYIQISYICFLSTTTLKFNRFNTAAPSASPYQLMGIESIGNKQIGFSGIGFDGAGSLNCIGANCDSACILGDKCKSNSGIVLGNSCFLCGLNSVFNSTAQTCQCKDGFFGNSQLCTPCDPSCLTCQQSGANSCTTCRAGTSLVIGSCLTPCAAGTFRQGPLCQPCPSFCQSCSGTSSCTQCQTGYSPNQSGVCLSSAPTSKIQLAGSVDSNRLIFQGVAINQMPSAIKLSNCNICSNLLLVNVTTVGVTVSRTVDYIVDSQYWLVITFDYGTAEARAFDFTVLIDPVHKALFTQADMSQRLSGNVDPTIYPSFSDAVLVKPTLGNNQISQSASNPGTGKPTIPVLPIKTNTTNPIQPAARGRLSTDSATVKAIFG